MRLLYNRLSGRRRRCRHYFRSAQRRCAHLTDGLLPLPRATGHVSSVWFLIPGQFSTGQVEPRSIDGLLAGRRRPWVVRASTRTSLSKYTLA